MNGIDEINRLKAQIEDLRAGYREEMTKLEDRISAFEEELCRTESKEEALDELVKLCDQLPKPESAGALKITGTCPASAKLLHEIQIFVEKVRR